MNSELIEALRQIEREKRIDPDIILEALKSALVSAYRRDYGAGPNVRVEIDKETGEIKVFSEKVVERDGKEEVVEVEVTPDNFGRIAAQTAKQVILQRIREAERELMYEEYVGREGDIVTGIIEQSDQRYTLVNLGRVEALLPPTEQIPTERYDHGTRLKTYIVEVRRTTKEPQIIVSRTHPGLLKRLFELEVPEIFDGFVEIKTVAREPGHRSKVAVASRDPNIDPVGACVGPRGSRVRMIVNELRGEKIDIMEWNEDPSTFVANALSPAKVKGVKIDEEEHTAEVIVPDDQLSLAIGKEGQNARLAAKLTGWRIDIESESQTKEKAKVLLEKALAKGKCQAITSSGKQCKNRAKPGSAYCGVHKRLE
ncbi:MAG TPA: transcription termination/antitermination protein NusA [Actinobacteria bacterium]|nr:transcription termination/antitermination protein NusA [Actinomycetota bacterium]